MVHATNNETVCKFVKVMQKKPWALFFRTRCTFWSILRHTKLKICI